MKTLYVMRPVTNAEEILEWAKKEKFINITKPSDLHVTIAYSKKKVEWNILSKPKDRISVFTKDNRAIKVLGESATVLSFKSKALQERWQYFIDNGCSWDYDSYTPHITISYVKQYNKNVRPYIGDIFLGQEVWDIVDDDWEKKNERSSRNPK